VDFAAAEEEECLQEVTNGNNVPDSNHQAAVSPSTSCQSLIFTVTRSQIHPLSTRPKPTASKRGRPRGGASLGATGAKPHFIFGDQKKRESGFFKSSSYIKFLIT
jgi:hypothetical protein